VGGCSFKNIYPLKKEEFSTQLLQLAKKMRMNTEQRKNIFCLIMSSEDYIEATERSVLVIC
jgi:nucleolar MIF4G domain-containing protein 1